MIIGCFKDLPLGKVDDGDAVTDQHGQKHVQPIYVLREATQHEYEEQFEAAGVEIDDDTRAAMNHPDARFYEIAGD